MSRQDIDTRSNASSRSGVRGSAVLARAREYNRMISENRSRSKSSERRVGDEGALAPTRMNQQSVRSSSTPRGSVDAAVSATKDRSPFPRDSGASNGTGLNTVESTHSSRNQHHLSQSNNVNYKTNNQSQTQYQNGGQGGNKMIGGSRQSASKSPSTNQSRPMQSQFPNESLSPKQQHGKSLPKQSSKSTVSKQRSEAPTQPTPVVTPELLVDALSGHEDGLLAIAERLMEHYDDGYDSMGEAIIDAFADVQKLFQHVVEAAHMEGAAYEASRKENEVEKSRRSNEDKDKSPPSAMQDSGENYRADNDTADANDGNISSRHDEFIDDDVREILQNAVQDGRSLRDNQKFTECYAIYEQACQSASALLPVDSDHRGRLQLSLARAESMTPERACTILKYVIDDVLRSSLSSTSKIVMPDPSKRGDCVLQRPLAQRNSGGGETMSRTSSGPYLSDEGVLQSSEEVLASLVEEMKEILSAPMYADCGPLQDVASRFWTVLNETQRNSLKNEEKLEHKLGMLKGEFLMAREEWEDKYNELAAEFQAYKRKTERVQDPNRSINFYSSDPSAFEMRNDLLLTESRSGHLQPQSSREGGSVVSLEGLTHHARSIVGALSSCGNSFDDVRENKDHPSQFDQTPASFEKNIWSRRDSSSKLLSSRDLNDSLRSR